MARKKKKRRREEGAYIKQKPTQPDNRKNKKQKKPEDDRADMKKASRRMLSISSGSCYIFNPRFRSCRMSEKENFPVSLSNFTALSFCTPSGVSIRFTSSGFPL